ncbi:DUF6705 family protein [Chryseobacterium kwangjuense]|nr:DUF6705 family protein [Chryseobacterium kwangjuense]
MKNKIIILTLLVIPFIFKAQTVSLDQMSQCERGINCPDYTYVKDTNNRLDKFVGTWKGVYTDGKTYELHFTKKENDGGWFNKKFWDKLIGRMLVKSSDGSVLYTSLNNDDLNSITGFQFDKNLKKYRMYYSANGNCNDKGYIFVSFPDSNNLTQMKLVFMQDLDISFSCPSGYKIVIPDNKVIMFTKQ